MNRALLDELDEAAFLARIQDNVARMEWLAAEILSRARSMHPDIGAHGLEELLSGNDLALPSLAAHWYADAA